MLVARALRASSCGTRVRFASERLLIDRRRLALVALCFAALWLFSGCATYSERLSEARRAADQGDYSEAIDQVNRVMGVATVEDSPSQWSGNQSLAALERGVLLQATGDYALSARDLSDADNNLEIIDLSTDAIGQIGEYIYSGSASQYKASPIERLSMNALNMLNFLASGDLTGAAVEARRFTNARDTLASVGIEAASYYGAYLTGFIFEWLGEGNRALRYYEEALAAGGLTGLAEPIARLASLNPYRGPRIQSLLAASGLAEGVKSGRTSEILTVVALGRVPYKVPERIPLGAAVGIAGAYISGNPKILERSVLKVLVYPELTASQSRARNASVYVDGAAVPLELVSSLGREIRSEYELIKPRIIGSAVSRMITRAVAAEGIRAAGNQAGDGGAIIGLLGALFAEASLVALDKPDTRSWTFLPDRISISRSPVQPGAHEVEVRVKGIDDVRRVPVNVPANGFVVVVVTLPQ